MIVTFALGSCLGITCYDRVRRAGAILHAMLPDATKATRANAPAAMYVDSGINQLLDEMDRLGSSPDDREYKVFGGASVIGAADYFGIGARNVTMMRRLALVHRLHVSAWEVGGQSNRTIQLYLDSGQVAMRMPNRSDTIL